MDQAGPPQNIADLIQFFAQQQAQFQEQLAAQSARFETLAAKPLAARKAELPQYRGTLGEDLELCFFTIEQYYADYHPIMAENSSTIVTMVSCHLVPTPTNWFRQFVMDCDRMETTPPGPRSKRTAIMENQDANQATARAAQKSVKKSAQDAYKVAKVQAEELKLFKTWIGKKWGLDYTYNKLGRSPPPQSPPPHFAVDEIMGRGDYYRNKYGGRRGRGGRGRGRSDSFSDQPRSALPSASWQQLGSLLQSLHNRNYGAYHELERVFQFQDTSMGLEFHLGFDHIQGDPYASPSRAHVLVTSSSAGLQVEMFQDKTRNVALCDYLTRQFAAAARRAGADAKTTSSSWQGAKGGDISIDAPGQHVIERSSVMVLSNGDIEARFNINLPARGRSICGDWAYTILVETLPKLVGRSLVLKSLDVNHLWEHLKSVEDQETLRGVLKDAGLVGFVKDGAVLPRQSGASDLPLDSDKAIAFKSPETLKKSFTLPNCGDITGMGIPSGVTLFVGGGFHGKSTVLKALEVGVYNHLPGDGREFVVVDPNAAKIRSEDSRSVVCTDISAFIDNLPFKQDTTRFSTADASGSTSQAANIVEALEVGATTLLIDEDTCATNFMIRDWKMQQLVAKDKEPITPFISKARALYTQCGVSSVLVIGGAGDYFSVADHVIMMDAYEPRDVTTEAKRIASEHEEIRQDAAFRGFKPRIPLSRGFEVNGKVVSRGLGKIQYGEVELDLSAVEQIVEPSQVRAIADGIQKMRSYMDGKRTLEEVIAMLENEMNRSSSLDVVGTHKKSGFYTRPRKLELAAAVNRLRTATMTQ